MINSEKHISNYMHISETDEKWGLVCTTAGMQDVPPESKYPLDAHPDDYNFKHRGRVLQEYQLVYIVSGNGIFKSASRNDIPISAGMMIMLFPGEWHYYAPLKEVGWKEYWVGFKGPIVDNLIKSSFFSIENPVLKIGYSAGIESCYEEIIRTAREEAAGFQMLLSGIVVHILGSVYYKNTSLQYQEDPSISIINSAREIMRDNIEGNLSVKEIADRFYVSYSWFRHKFKEYVGSSPTQYMLQLKYNHAKELLAMNRPISEIAYSLGFDNISQFSNFFKRYAGVSPRLYRQQSLF